MIHIKQIDGLRFVAIASVLITHWGISKVLPVTIPFGNMGVNLFFVISGFLITAILLSLKDNIDNKNATIFESLKIFYIRRTLRIFPIYYLAILVCFLLSVSPIYDIWGWLVSYTLNLGVSFASIDAGVFLHFWSLAVEEQFYLFFPLFTLLIPKRHLTKLFFGMILTAILSRFIVNQLNFNEFREGIIGYQLTLCCLDTFGVGALLAYWFENSKESLSAFIQKYFWLSVVFLILFLSNEFLIKGFSGGTTFGRFFFALSCFFIIGKAISGDGFSGIAKLFLENPIILYLGKISYGIYIYHNFVGEFVAEYVKNPYSKFLFRLIITIIISSISWKLIEMPFNNLKRFFPYQKSDLH